MGDQQYIASLEAKLEGVSLNSADKEKVIESFLAVDENRNGYLEEDEVQAAFEAVGKAPPKYKIRDAMQKLDTNQDKKLSPAEFAQIYGELCSDVVAEGFKVAVKAKKDIVTKAGHSTVEGTHHSYSPEEMVAFCNWINQNLKNDPDLAGHNLPIDSADEDKFFTALCDGIILCKMINLSQPDTIDERAINKKKSPNKAVQMHKDQENLNLALNSASAIGCSIVNIDANDIKAQKAHLVLGLLWQVIRIGLFAAFDLARVPGLAVLLEEGESLEDLMNLPPEVLLLRWVNYHLQNSPKYKAVSGKKISNFSGDIKDSYAYLCLLEQIQPNDPEDEYGDNRINVNLTSIPGNDKEANTKRAKYMLSEADKIDGRAFVTEYDVANGNSKLNLAFVANLFNTHPALEDTEEREIIVETREERTYRNWMNSLGVAPRVNRIFRDLTDGIVLSQLYEHVKPGIMKNNKINQPPFPQMGGLMKKVENCNTVVNVGKEMKYVLVGIDGSDIYGGNQTATLALTWQVMRGYTVAILEELSEGKSGKIGDKDIIDWTNHMLETNGKSSRISSFKDSSISTSHPVIDLVDVVGGKNTIDYSNVKGGVDEDEKKSNARYAISMARKIGARVYALPDDLWEVNQKMVMTVFACLMARSMKKLEE